MGDIKPISKHTLLRGALQILRFAAPDEDWRVQRHIVDTIGRRAGRQLSLRKRGRILSSAVLLEAGLRLHGPLAEAASTPLERSLRRRNGTMIAFLALLPIRLRSLSELTLGQSVLVTPSGISIVLSADMTKTGVPWETPVPELLEPILRRYISEVRPYFFSRGGRPHDALWVGKKGEVLGAAAISSTVAEKTEELTGVRVPPHYFRDAAASTLSRHSPDAARLIRPVLAHLSFGTAERHYIQSQGIEAGRDYAAVLAKLREDGA